MHGLIYRVFVRFSVYRDADIMDFVNAPIGKGLPISQSLRPLIAVPTTAGTGSETTGTAILDITSRAFKTGIANRAMKPVLGIVVSSDLIEACCSSRSLGYTQYSILPDRGPHQRRS
jgi:alcohol dehydrogenase class IV